MTSVETANAAEEALHCFVCDVAVTGRHYTLATCRTQSTKIRLIEKLGQLVGERYMVVICEDDIICRGCANLINTLDRLETEMGSVRSVVLRFLEKKYSLEEGELLNNKASGLSLPPQITPCNVNSRFGTTENYMYRKRKAALSDLENEENNLGINKTKKLNSKTDVWMQCDKCKYTTNYNAFMIHHVRQHVKKKKNTECEYCGDEVTDVNCTHQCDNKKAADATTVSTDSKTCVRSQQPDNSNNVNENLKLLPRSINNLQRPPDSEAETVEMIAAEINEFTGANRTIENTSIIMPNLHENIANSNLTESNQMLSVCENAEQNKNSLVTQSDSLSTSLMERNEEMIIPVPEMSQEQVQQLAAGSLEVQMENQEGSAPTATATATAICVMEMPETTTPTEPTLVTVQKMEDDNNAVYVQVVEVGKEGEISETSNVPKVLTLSDDGTVEMVEVMWDDMVTSDVASAQSLQF